MTNARPTHTDVYERALDRLDYAITRFAVGDARVTNAIALLRELDAFDDYADGEAMGDTSAANLRKLMEETDRLLTIRKQDVAELNSNACSVAPPRGA